MNCKKCGGVLTPFDKTCPACGEVNEYYSEGTTTETVANATENVVQPAENMPAENTVIDTPVSQEPVMPTAVTPEVTPEVQTPVAEEPVVKAPMFEPAPDIPTENVAPVEPAPVQNTPAQNINQTPVNNYSVPNTNNKGSNGLFIALLIILILIIVGLGGFIAFRFLSAKPSTPENQSTPTPDVEVTKTDTSEKNKVEIAGYDFIMPTDFKKIELSDGTLAIGKTGFFFQEKTTMISSKYTYEGEKAIFDHEKETFNNAMQKVGGTYISAGEETLGGKKYLTFRYKTNNYNVDIIMTELSDKSLFLSYVMFKDDTYRESGYSALSKFIESGKSSETSTFSADPNAKLTDTTIDKIEIPEFK